MSHFTVAVICDKPEDIEKLLAPYQENNMDDCPKEFLAFNNVEEEYRKQYEEEKKDIKKKYPTFENYIEEYCGYHYDDDQKAYGYWENPNAKWDWYSVGGRWMGSLLIKGDKEGELGRPGVFDNDVPNTPENYNWVDLCKVSDVCWEKMAEIAKFELLKNEAEDGDVWDILTKPGIDQEKRMKYSFYKPEWYIERYGNRENYIKSHTTFSTYAVITPDGVWHSPGEMGWFGCSTESHDDQHQFEDGYHKNFIEPNQDKYIAIVDCHI